MSYNSQNSPTAMTDFPAPPTVKIASKYNPLMKALRTTRWQVNPLIHEQSIQELEWLKIPKNEVRTLMKQIHQIAIKYLTYLIWNK